MSADQNPYESGTQDGVSFSSIIPGWLAENLQTLKTLVTRPGYFIRGIVFGAVLNGIIDFFEPILTALVTLFLGSEPARFGSATETWGIADVPAALARIGGDAVASVIVLVFETYASIIRALIPNAGSTVAAPLAAIALVLTGFVLFRIIGPTLLTGLQAVLEAVPVVGGPLATILGRLRS